jgi:hypothetical protein
MTAMRANLCAKMLAEPWLGTAREKIIVPAAQ